MLHERYASINRNLSERLMRKYAGDVVDGQPYFAAIEELDDVARKLEGMHEYVGTASKPDDLLSALDEYEFKCLRIGRQMHNLIHSSDDNIKPGSSRDRLDLRFMEKFQSVFDTINQLRSSLRERFNKIDVAFDPRNPENMIPANEDSDSSML